MLQSRTTHAPHWLEMLAGLSNSIMVMPDDGQEGDSAVLVQQDLVYVERLLGLASHADFARVALTLASGAAYSQLWASVTTALLLVPKPRPHLPASPAIKPSAIHHAHLWQCRTPPTPL